MEVVGFAVDGTRYGLEPQYARTFSQKLREFARGEYAGDLAEIKRRTGLDAEEWLDGAVPLAERVDRWAAEDRDDAIALADNVQARAAHAAVDHLLRRLGCSQSLRTVGSAWEVSRTGCAGGRRTTSTDHEYWLPRPPVRESARSVAPDEVDRRFYGPSSPLGQRLPPT